MLADFCTESLQGQIFKMFRYFIMGYTYIKDLIGNRYYPIKEYVGNSEQNELIWDSVFLSIKKMSRNK